MEKTTETRTADTILERNKEITIGDQTYQVAPPTIATLILVSELVAKMPQIELDTKNILTETLRIAKDCRVLGQILAVLILGEDCMPKRQKKRKKQRWWSQNDESKEQEDPRDQLAEKILKTMGPKKAKEMTIELLMGMEVSYFFGLTTSLIEVNLTKATREVGKTIAYGPL